jgi:hypothetical protein
MGGLKMANYYSKCRSNYFAVTDLAKFKDIMSHLVGEGEIAFYEHGTDKGKYMFYCDCNLVGYIDDPDDDDGYDDASYRMIEAFQKILPDDEAIILIESGSEKMRYIHCMATIITNSEVKYVNLSDVALAKAREMLGNPNFTTEMDY